MIVTRTEVRPCFNYMAEKENRGSTEETNSLIPLRQSQQTTLLRHDSHIWQTTTSNEFPLLPKSRPDHHCRRSHTPNHGTMRLGSLKIHMIRTASCGQPHHSQAVVVTRQGHAGGRTLDIRATTYVSSDNNDNDDAYHCSSSTFANHGNTANSAAIERLLDKAKILLRIFWHCEVDLWGE